MRLRKRLQRLLKRLNWNEGKLRIARRRHRHFRKRTEREHRHQIAAQRNAERLTRAGHPLAARPYIRRAARCEYRAVRTHARAVYWRGRLRVLERHVHALEDRRDKVEAELREWRKKHVEIHGNRAVGGTPEARFRAVCLQAVLACASGQRRNFYSQWGAWDIEHELSPGPEYGHRSDCSSSLTGWCWSAGLPDPNGMNYRGGSTANLVGEHGGWREATLAEMMAKGWGYIVYGYGGGHHVEAYVPSASDRYRTVGHGASPVGFGTVFLFGPSEYQRYYILAG